MSPFLYFLIVHNNELVLFDCFSVLIRCYESKKEVKDKKSIQSSTTPDPGYLWESGTSQLDITNESQEVSPFPARDHKASTNRRT